MSDIQLPDWFSYPGEYERIKDLNLVNLDPWFMLEGELLEHRIKGMQERYPGEDIVPFARRADNDDVACWAKEGGNDKVYLVHDYSDWGWKNRKIFNSFWDWFKQSIEDMIEHEQPYR